MGDQVLVEANLNRRMHSSVETDIVSIKGYFNDLGNSPTPAKGMPQNRNLESMVHVQVNNRKLLQFFEGQK